MRGWLVTGRLVGKDFVSKAGKAVFKAMFEAEIRLSNPKSPSVKGFGYASRNESGLGFRDLETFNQAPTSFGAVFLYIFCAHIVISCMTT